MKKYSLITMKFGNTLVFTNGIIEFSGEETLKVLVEKNSKNLCNLLEAGITFITVEKSYSFYVDYRNLFGVKV